MQFILTRSIFLLLFVSEEVCSLCKILLLYFHEKKALDLQTRLDGLLVTIEKHKPEIWFNESKNASDNDFEYGPGATVQSIVEKKNTSGTTKPKGSVRGLFLYMRRTGSLAL